MLFVRAYTIADEGGESLNTASGIPIVAGRSQSSLFAKMPNMCGFAVGPAPRVLPGAVFSWLVAVTPTRVAGTSVTFTVTTTKLGAAGPTVSKGTSELTLSPGQSVPLDVENLAPTTAMYSEVCKVRAASLRVALDYSRDVNNERGLMATDLWLVDRQPNGTERAQNLTVRGLPFRPVPFFFDSVTDGAATLDFYGEVAASPASDGTAVKLTTRSRLVQSGRSNTSLRMNPQGLMGPREVDMAMRLNNDVVANVELPRLSENTDGAFAGHVFSIRLRTRPIR